MSSIQEPKFTKITSIKSATGKIGTILDDVGAKPFYNKEINQWMYPWSYGITYSSGVIPENYIKEYKENGVWKTINHYQFQQ